MYLLHKLLFLQYCFDAASQNVQFLIGHKFESCALILLDSTFLYPTAPGTNVVNALFTAMGREMQGAVVIRISPSNSLISIAS